MFYGLIPLPSSTIASAATPTNANSVSERNLENSNSLSSLLISQSQQQSSTSPSVHAQNSELTGHLGNSEPLDEVENFEFLMKLCFCASVAGCGGVFVMDIYFPSA